MSWAVLQEKIRRNGIATAIAGTCVDLDQDVLVQTLKIRRYSTPW
jgi:hypothetical protein